MNKEAHGFAGELAAQMAADHFVELGYETEKEARPFFKRQIYLDWGCANVKEQARCLHALFDYVGSAPVASRRRVDAEIRTQLQEFISNTHQSCSPTPGRG